MAGDGDEIEATISSYDGYITCESCGLRVETTGHDGQNWKSGEKFTCKKCGHETLFNSQSQRINETT